MRFFCFLNQTIECFCVRQLPNDINTPRKYSNVNSEVACVSAFFSCMLIGVSSCSGFFLLRGAAGVSLDAPLFLYDGRTSPRGVPP